MSEIKGIVEAKADNGGVKIGGKWFDPDRKMLLVMDTIHKERIKGVPVVLTLISDAPGERVFTNIEMDKKAAQGGSDERGRSIERQVCVKTSSKILAALLQAKATLANCGRDELLDLWEDIADRQEKWLTRP